MLNRSFGCAKKKTSKSAAEEQCSENVDLCRSQLRHNWKPSKTLENTQDFCDSLKTSRLRRSQLRLNSKTKKNVGKHAADIRVFTSFVERQDMYFG